MAMIKLSQIKRSEKNPRKISKNNLQKLKKSISNFKEMMEMRPMVVDENWQILGGNQRYQALLELEYDEIPENWVIRKEGLTEEQKKEFLIRDNTHYGDWDFDILQSDFQLHNLNDWGLDFKWTEEDDVQDDGFDPEEVKETFVKKGDVITIGDHRLICGDSTEAPTYKELFGDKKANLYVTDPPYNVDYVGKTKDSLKIKNDKMTSEEFNGFLYSAFAGASSIMEKGASFYIWLAESKMLNFLGSLNLTDLEMKQVLVWVKNTIVMGRSDYHYKHEPCLYGWKEGASHNWYADRKQASVLEFDKPMRNGEHPTMKPVDLIAYQIKNSSKKGDIVHDNFLGSGSTMVAAHQLKRICYGIEIDPIYCQVIINRMLNVDPKLKVKINGKAYKPKK